MVISNRKKKFSLLYYKLSFVTKMFNYLILYQIFWKIFFADSRVDILDFNNKQL